MIKMMSIAAVMALPLMMAAGGGGARAASAGAYCTFTSPASQVCPTDIAPPVRVTANQVAVDHCVALSPASSACPAYEVAPVSVARTQAPAGTTVQASRN